eukprot:gi/632990825/ref/XP_007884348.1/ PREDICTED: nucleolar protein 6-like [Callorhinchus milii]
MKRKLKEISPQGAEQEVIEEEDEEDKEEERKSQKKRKEKQTPDAGVITVVKMNKKDLYKPPTNEELNELKETESLFHSNLLRMQVMLVHCNFCVFLAFECLPK